MFGLMGKFFSYGKGCHGLEMALAGLYSDLS